jgi:hypothetical protein
MSALRSGEPDPFARPRRSDGGTGLVFLGKLRQSPLGLRVVDAGEKPADARYLRPQKPGVVSHSDRATPFERRGFERSGASALPYPWAI